MLDIVRFIQRKRNTSKYAFACQFCRIFDTGKSTTIPVAKISTAKVFAKTNKPSMPDIDNAHFGLKTVYHTIWTPTCYDN